MNYLIHHVISNLEKELSLGVELHKVINTDCITDILEQSKIVPIKNDLLKQETILQSLYIRSSYEGLPFTSCLVPDLF